MTNAAHPLGETNSSNGALLSPQPTQMETFTGQYVDLLNPQTETIHIGDIAMGMARQRRYAGHTLGPVSVGSHVLHVAMLVEYEGGTYAERLAALFHDAAEPYLTDIPAPLKYALRQLSTGKQVSTYDMLTARMEQEVFAALKLPPEVIAAMESDIVRNADLWSLRDEADVMVHSTGANWRWDGLPERPDGAPYPEYHADDVGRMQVDDRRIAAKWLKAVQAFLPGSAREYPGDILGGASPNFDAGWVL